MINVWPYFEARAQFKQYNFQYTFYSPENLPLTGYINPIYYCPDDKQGIWKGDSYAGRRRGNYVVDWGYCDFTQTLPAGTLPAGLDYRAVQSQSQDHDAGDHQGPFALHDDVGSYPTALYGVTCPRRHFQFRSGLAEFMTMYALNSGIDSPCDCTQAMVHRAPCQNGGKDYVSARSPHPGWCAETRCFATDSQKSS